MHRMAPSSYRAIASRARRSRHSRTEAQLMPSFQSVLSTPKASFIDAPHEPSPADRMIAPADSSQPEVRVSYIMYDVGPPVTTSYCPTVSGTGMRMVDTIDVGVIGTGWCGRIRAAAAATSPLVGNVHVVEVRRERLAEVAAEVNAARATVDYADLVADDSIDALIISATPETTHYPMAKEALAAGKHVLLEEPIARVSGRGRRPGLRGTDGTRDAALPGVLRLPAQHPRDTSRGAPGDGGLPCRRPVSGTARADQACPL